MGESWLSHQGHLINLCEMNEWTWSFLSAVIHPLRLLLILSYSRTVLPACRKAWERVLSEASLATYSRPPSFSSGLSPPASCRIRAYAMLILVLFWSKEGLKNVKETGKQWHILKEGRQCVPTNPSTFSLLFFFHVGVTAALLLFPSPWKISRLSNYKQLPKSEKLRKEKAKD